MALIVMYFVECPLLCDVLKVSLGFMGLQGEYQNNGSALLITPYRKAHDFNVIRY